jgi:hypothetical protein
MLDADAKQHRVVTALSPSHLHRARRALDQGRLRLAHKLLVKALGAYWYAGDLRARTHHLLGIYNLRIGHYEEAETEMLKALFNCVVEKQPGVFGCIMRDYALVLLKYAEHDFKDGFHTWIPLAFNACEAAVALIGQDIDKLQNCPHPRKIRIRRLTAELDATKTVFGQIALAVKSKDEAIICFKEANKKPTKSGRAHFLENRLHHMRVTSVFKWPILAPRAYRQALALRSGHYVLAITLHGLPFVRWFLSR